MGAAEPLQPADLHRQLARYNRRRLRPALPLADWERELEREAPLRQLEGRMLEAQRQAIAPMLADLPAGAEAFMKWFEGLREHGPGQGDALFPWLAQAATLEQMRWFLTQEVAGEAGFEDLVALTQVGLPVQPKLEMARNYWDEMGRGHERGMHGPMLARCARDLKLRPTEDNTVWESWALANVMAGLAANRRYAYHAVGALGAIEMTAPGRVGLVNQGLKRLGQPAMTRRYFQLHAGLDIKHSADWNREVIAPLAADAAIARAMAEGALMRLACGARCFARYRSELGLGNQPQARSWSSSPASSRAPMSLR